MVHARISFSLMATDVAIDAGESRKRHGVVGDTSVNSVRDLTFGLEGADAVTSMLLRNTRVLGGAKP